MGVCFVGIAVTYVLVILTFTCLLDSSSPFGKMAGRTWLALCLLVTISVIINAESDADAESYADAESDGYYSPYGGYGGYSRGGAILRNYPAFRRSYYSPHAYRPHRFGRYYSPARRYSYGGYSAPAPVAVATKRYVEPYHAPVVAAAPLHSVPAVPQEHISTYGAPEIVRSAPAPVVAPVAAPAYHEVAAPVAAPAPAYSTASIKAVPSGATSKQYHAQDEFGNVLYGYNNPNSAKEERRDAHGNVAGSYSYIDATGVPKHLSYVADDYGFRVTDTNALPLPPPHPAH